MKKVKGFAAGVRVTSGFRLRRHRCWSRLQSGDLSKAGLRQNFSTRGALNTSDRFSTKCDQEYLFHTPGIEVTNPDVLFIQHILSYALACIRGGGL